MWVGYRKRRKKKNVHSFKAISLHFLLLSRQGSGGTGAFYVWAQQVNIASSQKAKKALKAWYKMIASKGLLCGLTHTSDATQAPRSGGKIHIWVAKNKNQI